VEGFDANCREILLLMQEQDTFAALFEQG
jgi:hypothetical protein